MLQPRRQALHQVWWEVAQWSQLTGWTGAGDGGQEAGGLAHRTLTLVIWQQLKCLTLSFHCALKWCQDLQNEEHSHEIKAKRQTDTRISLADTRINFLLTISLNLKDIATTHFQPIKNYQWHLNIYKCMTKITLNMFNKHPSYASLGSFKSITEVMNKTRMYGKVSNMPWAHLLLFHWQRVTYYGCVIKSSNLKWKSTSFIQALTTTEGSLQMEIFTHYLHCHTSLSLLGVPFKDGHSLKRFNLKAGTALNGSI